ncbi:MAG: glycosyltransferase [Chitinophagaceae bacterium]|nr:glycosyltransferase [Chitinophagaceae bacterium]
MPSPILSVIMPVYNAEKYVYEAIDSILRQTFADFELLIFDDCSTDSSREIILSFRDSRIRLIDSPVNTGYVKHLNEGLNQAKGKYIARMDADDMAASDRFLLQVQYLNRHEEVAVCGSWIEFIGEKQGVLEYPVDHRNIVTHLLLFGNAMAHPTVMLRKSVLTDHRLSYDASLEPAEDYDLWHQISAVAQLYNIPDVLLKYRVHSQNESVVKKNKQDLAVLEIRQRMIKEALNRPSDKMNAFVLDQFPQGGLTNLELTNIRLDVLRILNSGRYNDWTVKTVWSNRFVAWCQASTGSGWLKMIHYIRFPKYFFSMRICLSLLLHK